MLEATVPRGDIADLQGLCNLQRRCAVSGQTLCVKIDVDSTWATANDFDSVGVRDRLQFVLHFFGNAAQFMIAVSLRLIGPQRRDHDRHVIDFDRLDDP